MSLGTESWINWELKKDPSLFWPILSHFEVLPGFKNSLRIGEAQIGGSHPKAKPIVGHGTPSGLGAGLPCCQGPRPWLTAIAPSGRPLTLGGPDLRWQTIVFVY